MSYNKIQIKKLNTRKSGRLQKNGLDPFLMESQATFFNYSEFRYIFLCINNNPRLFTKKVNPRLKMYLYAIW